MRKDEIKKSIVENKMNRKYQHSMEMIKLAKDIKKYKMPIAINLARLNGETFEIDGRGRLENKQISDKEKFLVCIIDFDKKNDARSAMGMINNSRKYHASMKAFTEREVFVFLDFVAKITKPLTFISEKIQQTLRWVYNYDTLKRIVLASYLRTSNGFKQQESWSEIPKTKEYALEISNHMLKFMDSIISAIDKDKREYFVKPPVLIAWASLMHFGSRKIGDWMKINHYKIIENLDKDLLRDGKTKQAFWVYTFTEAINKPQSQKTLDTLKSVRSLLKLDYESVR